MCLQGAPWLTTTFPLDITRLDFPIAKHVMLTVKCFNRIRIHAICCFSPSVERAHALPAEDAVGTEIAVSGPSKVSTASISTCASYLRTRLESGAVRTQTTVQVNGHIALGSDIAGHHPAQDIPEHSSRRHVLVILTAVEVEGYIGR